MANFFGGFFKQMEKPQSVHPPSVPHEFSQYDSEYIKYCIEQEQTISNLERDNYLKLQSLYSCDFRLDTGFFLCFYI